MLALFRGSLAIQQILTPGEIDRVEVVALDETTSGSLEPGMRETELSDLIAPLAGSWQECQLDGRAGDQKRWNRPPGISLPPGRSSCSSSLYLCWWCW